jgi:hypothetical protein
VACFQLLQRRQPNAGLLGDCSLVDIAMEAQLA